VKPAFPSSLIRPWTTEDELESASAGSTHELIQAVLRPLHTCVSIAIVVPRSSRLKSCPGVTVTCPSDVNTPSSKGLVSYVRRRGRILACLSDHVPTSLVYPVDFTFFSWIKKHARASTSLRAVFVWLDWCILLRRAKGLFLLSLANLDWDLTDVELLWGRIELERDECLKGCLS
jgi:hypothetical protein